VTTESTAAKAAAREVSATTEMSAAEVRSATVEASTHMTAAAATMSAATGHRRGCRRESDCKTNSAQSFKFSHLISPFDQHGGGTEGSVDCS
jgi:hypothetical protein